MEKKHVEESSQLTRRAFAGAAATFMIVPRHVLGAPYTPPSDKLTIATIGLGRQGQDVTMGLLARPDVQVIAVCDCNKGSKDYIEYGPNALLSAARRLLGKGYEKWGEDLASPGSVQLTREFSSSLGMGGREPAKRLVEAYYGAHKDSEHLQRLHRLSRLSRTAGQRKRSGRRLRGHARSLARHHLHRGHAPAQACAVPEAHGAFHRRSASHGAGGARDESGDIAAREQSVERSDASSIVLDFRRRHRPTCARFTTGPAAPIGRKASSGLPKRSPFPKVSIGICGWVPRPERPYNKAYLPFVWRGWYDFGCGSFGDMGCYSFAGLFKILDLAPPTSVEASTSESFDETYPKASIVRLDYPARGNRPSVRMAWYDGSIKPERPGRHCSRKTSGCLFTAMKAKASCTSATKASSWRDFNGDRPRVYPESKKVSDSRRGSRAAAGSAITPWISGSPRAKVDQPSLTNFEIQSPVTEAFLLGCLAQRLPGERFEWDTANMRITNSEKANKYLDPPARANYS